MSELGRFIASDLNAARRRTGIWLTMLIWLGQIAVFAYLIPFAVVATLADELGGAAVLMREALSPAAAGASVVEVVPFYGIPVAVVLGALMVSGDYQHRTFALLVSRVSRRWVVVVSRFIALAVLSLVMAVSANLIALALSMMLSGSLGTSNTVNFGALMMSTGYSWLGLFAYASFSACLAYLFRAAMPAVLVAIGWTMVVEFLVTSLLLGAVPFFGELQKIYLFTNIGSIAGGVAAETGYTTGGFGVSMANGLGFATLIVCVWIVASILVSTLVVVRRDID